MLYADAEQISPRQSLLQGGALLARDVPIARTGRMTYSAMELPGFEDAADSNGWISVSRDPSEVFSPIAVASFEGVPVVMRHPDGLGVTADNWRRLAVGHAQNVRRSGDMLIADLLIHDRDAIDAVRNGNWRSISCGYDASYEPSRGGLRQTDIRGNHVAILHPGDEARCGPICRIGDQAPRRSSMPKRETKPPRRSYDIARSPTLDWQTTDRAEVNRRVAEQQAASRLMASRIAAFWDTQRHAG
jgi:hypothetical protein